MVLIGGSLKRVIWMKLFLALKDLHIFKTNWNIWYHFACITWQYLIIQSLYFKFDHQPSVLLCLPSSNSSSLLSSPSDWETSSLEIKVVMCNENWCKIETLFYEYVCEFKNNKLQVGRDRRIVCLVLNNYSGRNIQCWNMFINKRKKSAISKSSQTGILGLIKKSP